MLDEVIFDKIRNKDKKAFGYLFDRYYRRLFLFARKIVYDSDAAYDAVQNVLIKIWENSDKIQLNHSLKNYLFISVKNECLQYLRSLKIRDSKNQLWAITYLESSKMEDMEDMEDINEELYNQIRNCIEKLPLQCKMIYKYRIFYGFKYSEIASIMDTSEDVVKVQIFRANKILKSLSKITDEKPI